MFSAHKLFKCKKTMKLFKNSFNLAVTTPLLNIYVTWFPGHFYQSRGAPSTRGAQ